MLSKLSKVPRRYVIFAAIIIFVAVASAGIAVFVSLQQLPPESRPENTAENGKLEELPAEKKAEDAGKLAADGDLQGGVQELDAAIKNTTDSQEQFVYYSHKATLLYNNGQYDGAVEAAKQAFGIEKTSDSAAFVGQIAQEKGDAAVALEYYKKAISLIDTSDPFANEDKEYYQSIVNELEGKS